MARTRIDINPSSEIASLPQFVDLLLSGFPAGVDLLVNRANFEGSTKANARMLQHEFDGVVHVVSVQYSDSAQ
jgi:hypothetical protein